MLVKDCMTRHPIMIPASTPAVDVQKIMTENNIRHIPVVGDGKRLQGLVTRSRLSLKPEFLASLNVWEITRYVANLTVEKVMLNADKIITTGPDKTVERAARIMAEKKIGCMPVVEDDIVIGIITETDLLDALQHMLGLPAKGIRVTIRMPNRKGEFSKLASVIAAHSWGIMGIGSFPSPRKEGYYDMVLKITDVSRSEIEDVLKEVPDQEVIDIREYA